MVIVKTDPLDAHLRDQLPETLAQGSMADLNPQALKTLPGLQGITEVRDIKGPFRTNKKPRFTRGEIGQIPDIDVARDEECVESVLSKLGDELLNSGIQFYAFSSRRLIKALRPSR